MHEWAYRKCDCGERIHMNFKCSNCGGNPWNIKEQPPDEERKVFVEESKLRDIAKVLSDSGQANLAAEVIGWIHVSTEG